MNFHPGAITRAYGPTWLPDASEQIFNIGRQDRRSPCVMPADAIASECTEPSTSDQCHADSCMLTVVWERLKHRKVSE
ncbi:hypothetical protein CY34DRAFT_811039 [Suillus luteus UH-Slu-Lm8-n1]|uniref:Uncharacterized protein n=1 Tax=Suillus luteus UH-Slu-Lm8-n1 TaxID=930992 RepID=A0A0D0AF33_9AGAM|nr:hypothetical protein CY34DRAFT_811039 [Suillus luteus UH-Slu-Lm8-n1]